MKHSIFFSLFIISLFTACSSKNENIQKSDPVENKLNIEIPQNLIKDIKSEKINVDKSINKIKSSVIDAVDDCINQNEEKGLSKYDCANLLKP